MVGRFDDIDGTNLVKLWSSKLSDICLPYWLLRRIISSDSWRRLGT